MVYYCLWVHTDTTACLTPVHYCMIADSSNSISNKLWTRLKQVIRSIAVGFDIGPGTAETKIALVKYGRNVVREFDFDSNTDKTTVLDAIFSAQRLQRTRPGGTATPDAILECLEIFREQGQAGVPQVIMVFSDGVTFYKGLTYDEEQQRLRNAVRMSTAAGTINFGVIFTGNDPEEAQKEALIIAQEVQDRAFYGPTLPAIELQIVKELSCGKCMHAVIMNVCLKTVCVKSVVYECIHSCIYKLYMCTCSCTHELYSFCSLWKQA